MYAWLSIYLLKINGPKVLRNVKYWRIWMKYCQEKEGWGRIKRWLEIRRIKKEVPDANNLWAIVKTIAYDVNSKT